MEIKIRDGFAVTVDFAKLTPEMRERLMVHGFRQKVADAGAGKNAADGRTAGEAVVRRLVSGDWGAERADNGVGIARGLLIRARSKVSDAGTPDAWKKTVIAEVRDMATAAAFAEKRIGDGFGKKIVSAVAKVQAAKKIDI